MGIIVFLVGLTSDNSAAIALTLLFSIIAIRCLYRIFFHPLSDIPGPLLPKITSLWLYYHSYTGDEASVISALHEIHGPLLRVGPNHIDIADPAAIQPIYVTAGGFLKAPCYRNFDIDGHATIFSTLDPAYRTPRLRAVNPLFSTAAIRAHHDDLYACVDRMVDRLGRESRTGRPVNVLNVTRSLAVDIVTKYLFHVNYGGTEENKERLSVSAFVDACVAVGRFFYVPTWAFAWLEWAAGCVAGNEKAAVSTRVVDRFVDQLIEATPKESLSHQGGLPVLKLEGMAQGEDLISAGTDLTGTKRVEAAPKEDLSYQARLLALGLEETEVKAQCKDLIFAGTDSTGMNMAMICRYLASNPEKLRTLRSELSANKAVPSPLDIQALPYLSAVIKESLRLTMANPTRLPRLVPATGLVYRPSSFLSSSSSPAEVFIPPGTLIGASAFQLHHSALVFPAPGSFRPERWLPASAPPTAEMSQAMQKSSFSFGAGARACIARNLALAELHMATERLVESGVLEGARLCAGEVEVLQWFNGAVRGRRIELVWGDGDVEAC